MDSDPSRREQNMARWTFAGSLGVVAGPIALSAAAALAFGWRGLFLVFAGLTLILVAVARRFSFCGGRASSDSAGFLAGVRAAVQALRRREVLRWLTLLEFSDLMLDVLLVFLALYFVDVVGTTPAQAGVAVAVWTGVGLLGDLLLIPLLERVPGLRYLRWSAGLELLLFPMFLLAPNTWAKLVLLGLLGFFNAGWYSILMARLYAAMPQQSGTVMTVGNVFGFFAQFVPLVLGLVAEQFGLRAALWLLLVGPAALWVGLPRRGTGGEGIDRTASWRTKILTLKTWPTPHPEDMGPMRLFVNVSRLYDQTNAIQDLTHALLGKRTYLLIQVSLVHREYLGHIYYTLLRQVGFPIL